MSSESIIIIFNVFKIVFQFTVNQMKILMLSIDDLWYDPDLIPYAFIDIVNKLKTVMLFS